MPSTGPARPRPRGRPPVHTPEEQLARILEATGQLLEQREMDAHSMTEIARQAGMSKRTLYALVQSKAVLIERVIEHVGVSILRALDSAVTDAEHAVRVLERFLLEWIRAAHAPVAVNLFRLVLDERKNHPDVASNYFGAGNRLIRGRLTEWIRAQVSRRFLVVADPALFADVAADYLVIRPLLGMALNAGFEDHALTPSQRVGRIMKLFAIGERV